MPSAKLVPKAWLAHSHSHWQQAHMSWPRLHALGLSARLLEGWRGLGRRDRADLHGLEGLSHSPGACSALFHF